MSDVAPVESVELSRPTTLKALEGKGFSSLPQEVEIKDKGLMIGLRNLSERTRDTKREWSGYITKDMFGNLSLGYIKAGDEATAQAVEIEDLTGLGQIFTEPGEVSQTVELVIQAQEWRKGGNPLLMFGKDLSKINPSKIHSGVKVIPNEEFFALMHTHRGKDMHSPQDAFMVAEQQFRPDGRPQIPISIVVGPEDMYVIVAAKDSNIKNTSGGASTGVLENIKLSGKISEKSLEELYRMLDEYIQNLYQERRLGFYKGNLKDGILKRVV